jgi:GR25 family glycosyltransferase involved in LPS biosynthesis
MKSFIIRLSEFSDSVKWAEQAYNSAVTHGWDVEYFEGVNGQNETLEEYNIFPNPRHRKSAKAFKRKGTVGCFLSHYKLWQKCIDIGEPMCILEHDVTIHQCFPKLNFSDIIKLATGPKAKPIYIGNWWAGAMAYCVSPHGADKLINFVNANGAMPADTMLCDGVVNLEFYDPINSVVTYTTDDFSFTWNLQ